MVSWLNGCDPISGVQERAPVGQALQILADQFPSWHFAPRLRIVARLRSGFIHGPRATLALMTNKAHLATAKLLAQLVGGVLLACVVLLAIVVTACTG